MGSFGSFLKLDLMMTEPLLVAARLTNLSFDCRWCSHSTPTGSRTALARPTPGWTSTTYDRGRTAGQCGRWRKRIKRYVTRPARSEMRRYDRQMVESVTFVFERGVFTMS